MAFVGPEKKAKIKQALDRTIPKNWKWSLGVNHNSTIVLTIYSAPIDLIDLMTRGIERKPDQGNFPTFPTAREEALKDRQYHFNPYHWKSAMGAESYQEGADPKLVALFERIFEALNIDNFDKSDPMTDYFHVGHYVEVKLGARRWYKGQAQHRPFQVAA